MQLTLFSLTLMIGNSRLHWGLWQNLNLVDTWDTPHFSEGNPREYVFNELKIRTKIAFNLDNLPVILASVVPSQTAIWRNYPNLKIVTLADIPLGGIYPTLGVDRALAILGAGTTYGWPILVIDGGTALTFTGAINGHLIGGAILPGLQTQINALVTNTAALPLIELPTELPGRWANNTISSISSGIIYTIMASIVDFITDWRQNFPDSKIVMTGGDRTYLLNCLKIKHPDLATEIINAPNIIFQGMALIS